MKFVLKRKKQKPEETSGTEEVVKGGLSEKLAARGSVGKESPPQTPDAADVEGGARPVRKEGVDREGGGTESQEATVQSVEMVRVVPQQETASVTLERKRALPLLRTGTVDLAEEHRKLDKTPKFQCSACSIGPDCPEYKEGYVCAYNDSFNAFPVRDTDSVLELMKKIVDTNKKRMFRALLSEELVSGGALDANVTRQTQVVMSQLSQIVDLSRDVDRVTVQVQGDSAAQKGGGILAKLFGGGGASSQEVGDTLTINPPDPEARPSWEPKVETHDEKEMAAELAADESQERLEEAVEDPPSE